ncbi:YpiB family protein [Bacillus sp. SH5-2]|uniref:YpiB family protein n=1 Tax=Bacillus sp. SH5-2 TaxID=2217834 RepID=UPI0011EE06B7|nr:YpiB family protein [Bacillus sp. SH5-2]KAA0766425.1 IDEAL domain-containing protein [Bacillus sp. SH5-2]
MSNVLVEQKREFLDFLLNCILKRGEEGFALLYTFKKYISFSNRIHFVENAKKYPYGIEISAEFSEGKMFAFYKPNSTGTEGIAVYNHFNGSDAPIYIQINFKGKYKEPLYMEVLEDDECSIETHIDGEDLDEINELIKYNLIDHALDTRNEELFRKLIAN